VKLMGEILPCLVLLFGAARNGDAGPVTWTLQNVAFQTLPLGGNPNPPVTATAAGWFSYNAETDSLLSWNIVVLSPNDAALNYVYTPDDSFALGSIHANGDFLYLSGPPPNQTRVGLAFLTPLTDAGGVVDLALAGGNQYGNPSFTAEDASGNPAALATSGSVTAPEPATIRLILVAALAMCLYGRRASPGDAISGYSDLIASRHEEERRSKYTFHAGLVFLSMAVALPGQTWTQLSPVGATPTGRVGAAAVFAAAQNRLIVFGGETGGMYNDLWILSAANGTGNPEWQQAIPDRAAGSPPPRTYAIAAYDQATNRMIIWGGLTSNTSFYNDVWILTGADGTAGTPRWLQLNPSNPPPARVLSIAGYDPSSNRLIAFGGQGRGAPASVQFNDVWVLTNANGTETSPPAWIQLQPSGSVPAVRSHHMGAYDPVSNKLIIYGGESLAGGQLCGLAAGGCLFDTWVLSNANGLGGVPTWTMLSPTGQPTQTHDGSAFYDPASQRLILFGGQTTAAVDTNAVSVLSNASGAGQPNWQQLSLSGNLPQPRDQWAGGYDQAHNVLIVFAGEDIAGPGNDTLLSDTWVLNAASGVAPPNPAQSYSFADINYPGAVQTVALGINDSGQIVGSYDDVSGLEHGFLWNNGSYSRIDYPGGFNTIASGINASSQVVGTYTDTPNCGNCYGNTHSFLLSNGTYSTLPEAPGSITGTTRAASINTSGQIVGQYTDTCFCKQRGFLLTRGVFTTIDDPGFFSSAAQAINDSGQIVGYGQPGFGTGSAHGYLLSGGAFAALDDPLVPQPESGYVGTIPTGINNVGDIVGYYEAPALQMHGFLLSAGVWTTVDDPNSQAGKSGIVGPGINSAKQIVGSYTASNGVGYGFLAAQGTPVTPGPNLAAGSILNGADFQANAISPCSIATLQARGLAPNLHGVMIPSWLYGPMPYTLGGDAVTVGSSQAPIFNLSNSGGQEQITFQVPCDVTPATSVPLTVNVSGVSATTNIAVLPASPGIFGAVMSDGVTRAVVVRPDGSFISLQNPARRGEVVRLYATGLGPSTPSVGTNSIVAPGTDSLVTGQVIVGVNNSGERVISARIAPSLIGVFEVAFQVDPNAPVGNDIVLSLALNVPGDSTTRFSAGNRIPIQ